MTASDLADAVNLALHRRRPVRNVRQQTRYGDASERIMKYLSKVIVIACAIVVLLGSTRVAAQVSVDLENRYSNVGAIMVWRVDSSGTPLQLLGFVSGTLIRDRVMVTAGHFTAPAKALGELPPTLRFFASFSPTDAKDPKNWIPVVWQATHPSMPPCPPPPQCDPTDEILVAPLEPGIADVGLVFLEYSPRESSPPVSLGKPGSREPKERKQQSWDTVQRHRGTGTRRSI